MDLRPVEPSDEPFLRELLWLAVHWDFDPPPPMADPFPAELARYVGTALLEALVAEAQRRGLPGLSLSVRPPTRRGPSTSASASMRSAAWGAR